MPGENVKVAVRVRPFSTREKNRNTQLIVNMEGNTTVLVHPDEPKTQPRKFTFDHSYWSHDSFVTQKDGYCAPETAKYVDQVKIFNDLGLGMLTNAWGGYNCSIFAYGQTGSGKSYSIMGHGPNKGLVPRVCEQLFKDIESKKSGSAKLTFEVSFSMLEIYNEHVRDLLGKTKKLQGGLQVKERAEKGFYVEGLNVVPVGNFEDIKLRINEGDTKRTIAATKMNETSSRAHTIVTVHFKQNDPKTKTSKTSSINLVDLAGSERAKQTEATGDRFEEAKNINKSLLTLGNVIKALCDKGKGQTAHIPYRDSVLTKLLKNALGGNSKTVMIAAISPDAENYEQTLSTLRYADRAKSIKTVAKVNEAETNKLIQDLIKEKEQLLKQLEGQKVGKGGLDEEEMKRIRDEHQQELERYQDQMKDTEQAWEKRLADARRDMEEARRQEQEKVKLEKKTPHFSNLNEDPALMGKILHLIKTGQHHIGNGKEQTSPEICLNGPRIAKEHAVVENKGGKVILTPRDGQVLYNGKEIQQAQELSHQDRLRFGSNNLFVFINPEQAAQLKKKEKVLRDITFEYAQNEIAKNSGFNIAEEDSILQQEVMSLMQLVQDVNAMAEELERSTEFHLMLVSAEARGLESGRTEVFINVHDSENNNEYLWDKNRFLNRQVLMQEMYREYDETGTIPQCEKEKDPFWEPAETEVIVGVVSVPLNYLSHMLDYGGEGEDPLTVIDYKAKQAGFLKVELLPCDKHGKVNMDMVVDDPMDLVNKDIAFKINIVQAMNLPDRFVKTWCKYRFYHDSEQSVTEKGKGHNPAYNHSKLFKLNKGHVDHKFIDYLREKSLPVEIWGQQDDKVNTGGKVAKKEEKAKLQKDLESYKKAMGEIKAIAQKYPKSPGMDQIKKIVNELKK